MKPKKIRTILLQAFLIMAAFASCEKSDEPAPKVDLASNFVGTYKGKVNTSDGAVSIVWQITKTSGEFLKVTHTDTFEGEQPSVTIFNKVAIQDATTLNFDEDIIDGSDKMHFDGVAVLTGKTLSVTLQVSYEDEDDSAVSFDLVRQ